MDSTTDVQLVEVPLSLAEANAWVTHPGAGGIVVFSGSVRDHTQGRSVRQIEYEAYVPMALAEMQQIADTVVARWPGTRICIRHRSGVLHVGDLAVVIAVSAPHRREAFEGCQYAIDTIKQTVPIWKKEHFEDGSVWVAAHP